LINLVVTLEGRNYTAVRAEASRSAAATAESLGGGLFREGEVQALQQQGLVTVGLGVA
jgi:hypothetical protein